MSNNIQDKVVIITGASSGIGEATAKELSAKTWCKCTADIVLLDEKN